LDLTLGFKPGSTGQIVDFRAFSGGSRITIVRPEGFGGSYGLLP